MIHHGSCTGLQLSIIPEGSRDWVTMLLGQSETFFAEHTGNALLVPTGDLPSSYEHEYVTVEGTRIEAYTSALDVFFWQFGRVWMGLPGEGKAYVAAPVEHVRGALDGEIYLVNSPEDLLRALPDNCNLHWRSFSSAEQDSDAPEQAPFAQLLRFLHISGGILPETEIDTRLADFCQRWSIPLSQRAGSVPCSSLSATTVLWLQPQARDQWTARLGTIFDCRYGMDRDE